FDPAEIDRERGVIMEELNMYQDTPMHQIGWDFEKLIYGDQPMGWDQVGTKEVIMGVQQSDFLDYKNKLYTPDNTVIAIAGHIDEKKIIEQVQQFFVFDQQKKVFNFNPIQEYKGQKNIYLRNKK